MSWIVLFESEGRQAESIREALAEDGWQVELVSTVAAANAAVTSRGAQLVIANAELSGAADVLGRFARTASGPGSLALVAPGKKGSTSAEGADERLSRPLADNELRMTVRRMVTANRAPKLAAPADATERLTSRDLFGDLLSEVDTESPAPKPAASPAPKAAPAAPSLADQISGLRPDEKPKGSGAKRESTASGVDDLLSKTLSGLEVGDRIKRAPAARQTEPSAAATKPAEPVGAATVRIPVVPVSAKPEPAAPAKKPEPAAKSEPVKPAPKPVEKAQAPKPEPPKAQAPAAPAPAKAEKPAAPALETTPARKGAGPLDLSALDALAKGKAKGKDREKTPSQVRPSGDAQATQKIAFPGAALRSGSNQNEFGEYTLLERIALGGMAEVWKARRKGVEGFQKTVAIKKILPHLTDSSDFVTMFIDEAKLAAQLNHTNIIHIYDLGKINDDFFIAMEYVDGKDLRSILNSARDKKLPMPLGMALLVGSRLASALDYAHRKKDFEGRELGLVHRDVSPQNVLISFEGDIKLCDFGIVKAVSKASKTQMGALKGKLQYMSPEQAWGRTVDARSDIFSLGALLFEMLTGQRLFTGESEMSVLDAVREGRVQAPRDLDPRLPLEVNALVLKALAKEPKDRFASAGDLHREVDAILASLKPAPTQNDLALYMAKLFDVEARVPAPAAPATPEAKPVPAPAAKSEAKPAPAPKVEVPARAAEPALAPEPGRPDEALESAPAAGNRMLFIGVGAAAALALVGWLLFGRGGTESSTPPAATPPSAEPSAPAPQPAAPAPAAAEKSAPPAPAAAEKSAPPAPVATEKPAAEPAAPVVDDAAKRREEEERKRREDEAKRAEAAKADAAAKAAAAAAAVPTPAPAAPVEAPRVEPTPAPVVAPPAAAPPAATRPAPAPAPAPAPKVPSVREGDLVTPGAGVKMPVLVSVSKPEYPPIARRMKVEGTVVLSLLVDENGRVVDVRLERGVSQNVGINEAAIAAARTAKYQPATKDGVRVKIWHSLTIPFKL